MRNQPESPAPTTPPPAVGLAENAHKSRQSGGLTASVAGKLSRTHVVWAALAGSMTIAALALTLMNGPVTAAPTVAAAGIEAPSRDWREQILTFDVNVEPAGFSGIVVHHSGSPSGSAETITRQHAERGIRDLGYHFVIGNGHGARDGEIQIGPRWVRQLPGAHVVGPRARSLNETTIGVCVVGDGDRRPLTAKQFASLVRLVRELQRAYGVPSSGVVLHRDVAATASPGRLFPEPDFEGRLLTEAELRGGEPAAGARASSE